MEDFNAPLRYRFDHLEQARVHVARAGEHSLFFFRHPRLSLRPSGAVSGSMNSLNCSTLLRHSFEFQSMPSNVAKNARKKQEYTEQSEQSNTS